MAIATRLRQIFADYEIETVIDVGANQGQYRSFLRYQVGFKGRIESFEPIPELVEQLKRRAARDDPKWSIHPWALGAEPGDLTLNITRASTLSSFHKPIRIEVRNADVVATTVVPVRTLDAEFAASEVDLRRTYLKLDTQGFDLEVLRGGAQVISTFPALQTEVSFHPFYEGMPDYKMAIAAFETYGFVVADFFLVAKDTRHRAREFDCLMVRQET